MQEVLDAIEKAIERSGMSASAVSRLATGNPSAFKNMKNAAETRSRNSSVDNLRRFAEVLGLEFYFGPPREQRQFGEPQAEYSASRPETMQVIHHLDQSPDAPDAPDSLGIPPEWFADRGLDVATVALVTSADASMAPVIPESAVALVDTSDRAVTDRTHIHAVALGDTIKLRYVALSDETLTLLPTSPDFSVDTLLRKSLRTQPVLGRVRAVFSSKT